jgi:long-subunit fatty acid transport protein
MRYRALAAILVPFVLAVLPQAAKAGGPEFPAGGTRSLGRGAAGFARADDPSVMVRNPALLADLWDDQALLGAHFLLPSACFQPTGTYGWNVTSDDVSNFGQGPVFLQAQPGDKTLDGKALKGYGDQPYPNVCYRGGAVFLPQVGLSMKLSPDLGVGLGFFPPDTAEINQWGNRDGTVDTADGRRPNPLRFYRSHLNVSFFTLMSAVGYRLADWIRIGAGFQWNVAAFQATNFTQALVGASDPRKDVRTNVFGRDLFIPGVVASVDIKPIENLDIALGYRWSDRVVSKAKLDIQAGAFGTGEVFHYIDAGGQMHAVGSSIPTTTYNQTGTVNSPPIYVPQLSFGVRYASRLKPAPKDREKAVAAAGRAVEDHMATERWDIEADGVYYFNSAYDTQGFTSESAHVSINSIDSMGNISSSPFSVGRCVPDPVSKQCMPGPHVVRTNFGGKNQLSGRIGGDYNVLPGVLALRAGVSYETDGQKIDFLNVMDYMLRRIGLHGGFTLRVAERTDISFGFAHFIQRKVRLQVNDSWTNMQYPKKYKTAEAHFQPGLGVSDAMGVVPPGRNGFDGTAGVEIPNGDATRTMPGPDFVNAGSYYYNLDVASLSFTQHF